MVQTHVVQESSVLRKRPVRNREMVEGGPKLRPERTSMQREPQVQRPWGRNVSGELEEQQGSWVVWGNAKRGEGGGEVRMATLGPWPPSR